MKLHLTKEEHEAYLGGTLELTPPKPAKWEPTEKGWSVDSVGDIGASTPNSRRTVAGASRKTKEQARSVRDRRVRSETLSALVDELEPDNKGFVRGVENYHIMIDVNNDEWEMGWSSYLYEPAKVYMSSNTATKICEMLNSGEFSFETE